MVDHWKLLPFYNDKVFDRKDTDAMAVNSLIILHIKFGLIRFR